MGKIAVKCQNCGKEKETYDRPEYSFCSKKCQAQPCIPLSCEECQETFFANGYTWRVSRFCSSDCFNTKQRRTEAHKKFVRGEAICEHCKSPFQTRRAIAKKQRYCSSDCASAAMIGNQTGDKNPRWKPKIKVECIHCKKSIETYPCRKDVPRYCPECKYRTEPVSCLNCGKVVDLQPSRARVRIYCSADCQLSHQSTLRYDNKRTTIEITIAKLLQKMEISFVEQFPLGWYTCDFYLSKYNTIIECDGDYWHSLPKSIKRDTQKDKYLTKHSYIVLRLSEHKIKNDLTCCETEIRKIVNEYRL